MNQDDAIKIALYFLALLMTGAFVALPWNQAPNVMNTEGVAQSLFSNFSFALVIMSLLLAVAMIGGIYLAKMEGRR